MLAFEEAGSPANRPLIFLHGWCLNRGDMKELMQHFSARHHVIAVDLPGHGESPLGGVSPCFESFAESVSAFIAERQLNQPVLIGHSMGGVISVVTAALDPKSVGGVVNLDGAVPIPPSVRDGYRDLFIRINREGFQSVVAQFVREAFFLPFERGPISEAIVSRMISQPERIALALLKEFPALDAAPILVASQRPSLFIGSFRPRFDETALKKVRPDAWVARVAVSGHFIQIFALPQIVAMIEKFIAVEIEHEPEPAPA
jgi:pimeloyl-ACP methyl ester carboxylesterase